MLCSLILVRMYFCICLNLLSVAAKKPIVKNPQPWFSIKMLISPDKAVELILQQEVVALPTETVYGLFGLADSLLAVNRCFEAKNRPRDNPLICHFYSPEQVLQYVESVPSYFHKLAESFWPGPLTLLLPLKPNSELAPTRAGHNTITCRIPDNEITLDILKQIDVPLFGPSANTSQRVSGVYAEMIEKDLGDKIAGVVDGGFCKVGLESTILDCLNENQIGILRPGAIGKKELENALCQDFPGVQIIENSTTEIVTPGSKYKHYSPKTKISLSSTFDRQSMSEFVVLGFDEDLENVYSIQKISLGSRYDLNSVAMNLFKVLNSLDSLGGVPEVYLLDETLGFLYHSDLSIAKAIFNRISKVVEK
jgi:L-threonylcarbamoyladenylate synthase